MDGGHVQGDGVGGRRHHGLMARVKEPPSNKPNQAQTISPLLHGLTCVGVGFLLPPHGTSQNFRPYLVPYLVPEKKYFSFISNI
jgi:hypothetical protein